MHYTTHVTRYVCSIVIEVEPNHQFRNHCGAPKVSITLLILKNLRNHHNRVPIVYFEGWLRKKQCSVNTYQVNTITRQTVSNNKVDFRSLQKTSRCARCSPKVLVIYKTHNYIFYNTQLKINLGTNHMHLLLISFDSTENVLST